LWRTKFLTTDQYDIERIQQSGIREVWIDTEKSLDIDTSRTAANDFAGTIEIPVASFPPEQSPKRASLSEEMLRAAKVCAESKKAVTTMFQEARMGKSLASEEIYEVVGQIADSVMRNQHALVSLARLKTSDDYTYMHSVAVCALMVSLAGQMNLDENQTREAGVAGLVHDIGKAMTPKEILNKPGKLTDEEFKIVQAHPAEGHKLLTEGGAAGEVPMEVCLHHHEKINGSGYPDGLKGEQITLYARMGAICDIYDATTSNRPYKDGWDPAESIHRMARWTSSHLDDEIFQQFVKSVGIYPVGSLVRLSSGRLAVVVEQSTKSLLMPKVKAIFSTKAKAHVRPELIDLSRRGLSETIVGPENAASWGLKNLEQYWAN
jgi:putative nucleotidyltransferase with HDIG domain